MEEPGHRHVRGVTGAGVAGCPAKGCGCALTGGRGIVRGPEELWVRGPGLQGLRRGREMPVLQRRSPRIGVPGASAVRAQRTRSSPSPRAGAGPGPWRAAGARLPAWVTRGLEREAAETHGSAGVSRRAGGRAEPHPRESAGLEQPCVFSLSHLCLPSCGVGRGFFQLPGKRDSNKQTKRKKKKPTEEE